MTQTVPPSPNDKAIKDDNEIDLMALLLALLRGWKTILATALLGLLLGVTYSRYVQPTYQTDALLQIDNKSKSIAALGANISELVGEESTPAETERELIKSRMVLQPVVEKLHLDIKLHNPELSTWDRILHSKKPTQTSSEQGVVLETSNGRAQIGHFEVPLAYANKPFTLVKTSTGFTLSLEINEDVVEYKGNIGTPTTIKTPDGDISIAVDALPATGHPINLTKVSTPNAIDSLNNALVVEERGQKTGIIELTLSGEDQKQVSRILTDIIDSYTTQNLARGSQQTTTTIEFMESQIPQLKQKLELSEEAFNKFREQYGTIDVTQEAGILINESAAIEKQTSELNLKKAELLTYYTEQHPLVIQINDQLSALSERRSQIKEGISRLPEMQREFLQLSQDTEINREIYLTMLKNYQQLKIAQAGEIGYVRIVDLPINTYKIITPKKGLIQALSLLSGLLLGVIIVFLKSLLRKVVKDPERLEAKTGVPVIATIPRSKTSFNLSKKKDSNRRLLAMVEHDGLSYEGIKSLRTSLMFAMPKSSKVATVLGSDATDAHKQGKVIVISGEAPNIGKSFISSNLAETFSQLNKKVLIIDGDMRRGELHKIFTVSQNSGLGDYLTESSANLSEFIHPTSFEFIDFMPRGKHPHNPASLLSTEKFGNMMAQLVDIYDYIIIDTPPVLAVSDAIITAQYADKVLMVTRYNSSIEGQLTYAVRQMNKSNITVDGIILNDVVQGITDKYSYHYSYAYGNSKD
uniref:Non-specific protein-tyrosine kinase n=1 Tax=Psychrobacter sp. (strain PRwf-1) TaxID=349106 RepID=A5WC15_PSYWF